MKNLQIPQAIVIGAIIMGIGLGLGLGLGKSSNNSSDFAAQLENYQLEQQQEQLRMQEVQQRESAKLIENVAPISEVDHVRGAKNPKVTIVEYSDFECPFCKRFHETMIKVIKEYPNDVAWVYRHAPIEGLHPIKAKQEAIASECAADLGGEDAFWTFADRFNELTPSNNRTELDKVFPQIVKEMGLDQSAFDVCLESGKFDQKIADDLANWQETGGRGTPWSIMITQSGEKFPINGAQPIEALRVLIEEAIK